MKQAYPLLGGWSFPADLGALSRDLGGWVPPHPHPSSCQFKMAILGDVILEWPFRGLRIKGRHFRMAILGEVICENVRMAIEEIKLALTPYWGEGPFWPTCLPSPATWVGGYPPPSRLPDPGSL